MKTNSIEDIFNGTFILHLFIIAGVILTFIGIIIALYNLYKKKLVMSDVLRYFLPVTILGLLTSTVGLLITFLNEFDINVEPYQYTISFEYILSVCILGFVLLKIDKEKAGDNDARTRERR